MVLFGNIVVYIIMAFAVVGAFASIFKEGSELGNQFLEGLNAIGAIFLPVAGIMAATPYITQFVTTVFGPAYSLVGADPSMAATTFIAVDMGGYQLADALAKTRESWIMAMITGYLAGATIVFSIPVALKMIKKQDRKYLALGMMSGFITIPVGVLISSIIVAIAKSEIREIVSTNSPMTYQVLLSFTTIFLNLIPLIIICGLIVVGLLVIPEKMITGFNVFGKILDSSLRIIFVFSVVEYFTGLGTTLLGSWGFDPIIADEQDVNRALELSGYIGIMLCGAFPMVYFLKRWLQQPLEVLGKRVGLSADASAGVLAASANVIALFSMIEDMEPEDKIITISFSVCGAFLIGDHLAFTANFQPSLILPIMLGKLGASILAIYLAKVLVISRMKRSMPNTNI